MLNDERTTDETETRMTDLIWNPDVTLLGSTMINQRGLIDWVDHNGLKNVAIDSATPLHDLMSDCGTGDDLEQMIEFGGRHCYRSWEAGRDRGDYIRNIIGMNHGSVLEHSTINLAIQGVSRSLSHELVRHRVGVAISQESQRYVDAKAIKFVVPPLVSWLAGGSMGNTLAIDNFASDCEAARASYIDLQTSIVARIKEMSPSTKSLTMIKKRANEAARALLPNAAETRLLWTPNLRLLRHFLWMRGGEGADLEIRRLAVHLLHMVQSIAPNVFADFVTCPPGPDDYGVPTIATTNG